MRRRLLTDFASDIAAIGAVITIAGLAGATWLTAGLFRPKRTQDVAAKTAPSESTDTDTAKVDSAEIVPTMSPKAAATTKPITKHNVILITIDTLRADLGFMGYPRPVTPNIDALAAQSAIFEHAYAMASFTPKCLGPLHIGRYSSETHRDYQHYTNFEPANVFLAERVQAAGGHTLGAATHRYFGWKKGFDQGFDVWDTSAIPPNSVDNDPTPTSEKLTDLAIEVLSTPDAAEVPVRRGKSIVTQPRTGPAKDHFFVWFHYLDPHLPYVPHAGSPALTSIPGVPRERAPYDGEVWYTDREIGRLLKHIAAQPWAKDTAIILTADHGEAFGEHGHWGHGRELWEPLVHVPLLVLVPGEQPRRIQAKRSHIDLVPTVLDLMGLPADPELHGTSLLRDLEKPNGDVPERDIYIDMPDGPYNEMRRAVLTGPSPGLKLIDFGSNRYELYDLRFDPNETKNLAGSDKTQLRAAQEAMSKMRASLKERAPTK
jgi:choline-sulfatase